MENPQGFGLAPEARITSTMRNSWELFPRCYRLEPRGSLALGLIRLLRCDPALCSPSPPPLPCSPPPAPCVPRSVVVGRSCEEYGAVVSLSPSPMVTSFLLTATGASGDVRMCETADANCTLARLPCGEAYTVNVTASDGNCTSEPSVDVFFQTSTRVLLPTPSHRLCSRASDPWASTVQSAAIYRICILKDIR